MPTWFLLHLWLEKKEQRKPTRPILTDWPCVWCLDTPGVTSPICVVNPFVLLKVDADSFPCRFSSNLHTQAWWQLPKCKRHDTPLLDSLPFLIVKFVRSFSWWNDRFIFSRHHSGKHEEAVTLVALVIYFMVSQSSGAVTIWVKRGPWSEFLDGQDVVLIFSPWQQILCLIFFLNHLSFVSYFARRVKGNFDILRNWYLHCCNWTEVKKMLNAWIYKSIKLLCVHVLHNSDQR